MQRATSPAQYPALSFRRPPECGRKDLSLAELAELIEQLPQIDWSPAIEAAARADHLRAELVLDAVKMAIARRRPGPGLVHHSDRGSQYVSLALGEHLREAGIETSMGAKGSAYDNAVAESFFSTLKRELVNRYSWPTRADARAAIFEWVEVFYNRSRIHTTLDYASPEEFENLSLNQLKEAA